MSVVESRARAGRCGDLEQSRRFRAGSGGSCTQRGDKIAQKDNQVVVVFIQRQPGRRYKRSRACISCPLFQPRADQGRLSKARAGANQGQRFVQGHG